MPLRTIGITCFLLLAPLAAPQPRTPEGRPDLSGVWIGNNDPHPEKPVLLPWAAAAIQKRKPADQTAGNPAAHCLPNAVPLAGPAVYKLVQTPELLLELFQDVIGYRQIFLDGRTHPSDPDPSWNGHSVGRWEGDTLLIDTVGFNDKSWLHRYPHTETLHTVERYQRLDRRHLQVEITIDDPGAFARPWKIHNEWRLAPAQDVLEYVCNDKNQDLPRLPAK